MIEKKEEKIDGKSCLCVQFSAMKAFRLKMKLIRLFGDGFLRSIGGVAEAKSLQGMDTEEIANGLSVILEKVDESKAQEIILEVLAGTTVEGVKIEDEDHFNLAFDGDLLTMYKVVWFALKTNYSSFFKIGDTLKVQ